MFTAIVCEEKSQGSYLHKPSTKQLFLTGDLTKHLSFYGTTNYEVSLSKVIKVKETFTKQVDIQQQYNGSSSGLHALDISNDIDTTMLTPIGPWCFWSQNCQKYTSTYRSLLFFIFRYEIEY